MLPLVASRSFGMSDYDESHYRTGKTASGALLTVPSPGLDWFTPKTTPRPGSYLGPVDPSRKNATVPLLLQPLKLRSLEFKNRIFLS